MVPEKLENKCFDVKVEQGKVFLLCKCRLLPRMFLFKRWAFQATIKVERLCDVKLTAYLGIPTLIISLYDKTLLLCAQGIKPEQIAFLERIIGEQQSTVLFKEKLRSE